MLNRRTERADDQKEWYQEYYHKKGADRNDLRTNRGVLFQTLASEASIVQMLWSLRQDPRSALVLDVGCGGGAGIYQFLRLGYDPENVTGIDIQKERLARARKLYPQIRFIHGDATSMELETGHFDLVFESTMFVSLPDDVLSAKIATEMVRVCKPGAYILLADWRTPKFWDVNYKALTRRRLKSLFRVGDATEIVAVSRGALVPPIGRFLSAYLPSIYFLVSALCPFLVGQVVYLLKKNSSAAERTGG